MGDLETRAPLEIEAQKNAGLKERGFWPIELCRKVYAKGSYEGFMPLISI